MQILFIHYHLKPGGVTTVIKNQILCLEKLGISSCVLAGEIPPLFGKDLTMTKLISQSLLLYDDLTDQNLIAEKTELLYKAILAQYKAEQKIDKDTIIHVHNPTLQKNSSLLFALNKLANDNIPILFQVHDFPEDYRADVYPKAPYPNCVHWAAINKYDTQMLKSAGADQVHFLPNPVMHCDNMQLDKDADTILYPVRAIPRKNIGELLFLYNFTNPKTKLAITLPPSNSKDYPFYNFWKQTISDLVINVELEAGLSKSLNQNYARTKAVVTTSVKEGFGLSYIEPLMRGRITLGRRIEKVVSDFESEGLSWKHLYKSIVIPEDFYNKKDLLSRLNIVLDKLINQYKTAYLPNNNNFDWESLKESILNSYNGNTDFGRLDAISQKEVLIKIQNKTEAAQLININNFLYQWDDTTKYNIPNITNSLEKWTIQESSQNLKKVYDAVIKIKAHKGPDKKALLEAYLNSENFYASAV